MADKARSYVEALWRGAADSRHCEAIRHSSGAVAITFADGSSVSLVPHPADPRASTTGFANSPVPWRDIPKGAARQA